ncbi:MAG: SRPBCC family protein [Proteobacteria bacterium]|nr:SRPBCC family protein [Pseudomonadota bacterium]
MSLNPQAQAPKPHTVTHATFVIERQFDCSRERAFAALADPVVKRRWFVGPGAWDTATPHELDFREGGHERVAGGPPGGPIHHYDATYVEIVPNERIVTTYQMHMDTTRISVSLATFEFKAGANGGTVMTYTEHGAYLDGWDYPAQREEGTKQLFNQLEAELAAEPAI